MKPKLNSLLPLSTTLRQGIKQELVNARDLWKFLDSKQEFANWIKNNIKAYGFKKDWDYFLINLSNENSVNVCSINLSNKKDNRGRKPKEYLITLSMAKELAMVDRSEQGRLARQYFIKCEEALAETSPQITDRLRHDWYIEREAVKTPFTKMCNALERSRTRQGKPTQQHHFSNEANMLSSLAVGMNIQHWRQAHAITVENREAFNAEQLARLEYLEQADEMLLDMNITDFQQRKQRLAEMLAVKFGAVA